MAANLNKEDLEQLISIVHDHDPPNGDSLIAKLQALRDTYYLYPDVWVSTVGFRQGQPVEMRADVMHISPEAFDELMTLDED